MAELEIYRTVRRSLVMQALALRNEMHLLNTMGFTTGFDRAKSEWVACQDAMVALRRLLYGG